MAALASGPHELMVGVRLLFHHKPLKFFTRLPRVSAVSCGLSWYCAMTYFYGAKSGSWKVSCSISAQVSVAPCRHPSAMAYWCAVSSHSPFCAWSAVLTPASISLQLGKCNWDPIYQELSDRSCWGFDKVTIMSQECMYLDFSKGQSSLWTAWLKHRLRCWRSSWSGFYRYSQPTYCAEPGKVPGSWRYSQDLSLFVRNRTFPNVLLHVKVIMMHDSNSWVTVKTKCW